MKHPLKITMLLVTLFIITQIFGLAVLNHYIVKKVSFKRVNNSTVRVVNVSWNSNSLVGQPPKVNQDLSFLFIFIAILISTLLFFILVKFKAKPIWGLWYALAVFSASAISLAAFVSEVWAVVLAVLITLLKVKLKNPYIHNLTEPFIYAGVAVILVPFFNMFSIFGLLILIAIYDYIAVNKSKHMISLAKFQLSNGNFVGLAVPKNISKVKGNVQMLSKEKNSRIKNKGDKTLNKKIQKYEDKGNIAILGGGDITFPLVFAGVMLKYFPIQKVLLIPLFSAVALTLLFVYSRKNKFYPAMPFLTAGCALGYVVALLI